MSQLYREQKKAFKGILIWLLILVPTLWAVDVHSFELLSEGAMDSVSAVSEESAEDFLNVAGPAAAGLRTDYEDLPFEVDVDPGEIVRDEVETELDFALTQEVEVWADTLRRQGEVDFEIGIVNQLPREALIEDILVLPRDVDQVLDLPQTAGGGLFFEIGRVEQTKTSRRIDEFTMTGTVERYLERASIVDTRVDFENPSWGNAYISNVRSRTNVTFIDRSQQ